MQHGARNEFVGEVTEIKKGDKVKAIVKAVNVLLVKD